MTTDQGQHEGFPTRRRQSGMEQGTLLGRITRQRMLPTRDEQALRRNSQRMSTGNDHGQVNPRSLLHAAGMATGDDTFNASDYDEDHRPLPLADLYNHDRTQAWQYVVTSMDDRGRLADRIPPQAMGWTPGTALTIAARPRAGIVLVRRDGPHAMTSQGHLRLPANVRYDCGLNGGERLLVVARPDQGAITIYTLAVLDAMITAHDDIVTDRRPR
jgi:bifunctional DNA-binding transcriptional regulator/antitoxin component of YhaV-PrlF toxin-antitoxin module